MLFLRNRNHEIMRSNYNYNNCKIIIIIDIYISYSITEENMVKNESNVTIPIMFANKIVSCHNIH